MITSKKIDVCEEVAKEINDTYGSDTVIAIACNISDKDQLDKLHSESVAWCGDIDTLQCCNINLLLPQLLNHLSLVFEKT